MLSNAISTTEFTTWEEKHGIKTQHIEITGADDVHQKLQNHEIDGCVLNESPQWEKENLSAVILIGGSYNYFIINKNRSDLKEELDAAMQKIVHENPFYTDDLYKRYLSANSVETLSNEEEEWIEKHGVIRIGYLKNDAGVSLVEEENEEPVGIINDYIEHASNCLGKKIKFTMTGFDSQEEQLQALKDDKIKLI